MTGIGANLGFEFSFADHLRMHNTCNVHQLLHWADQHRRMRELKQAPFTARFTDCRNLSDDTVLADLAGEVAPARNTK